ncbi:HAMP domain-containing sensor histidine kinase [Baekduia sp. Peel2402]|uniref:HAMP domain-containing sensor histidine kinase n=1 Tax=Baekduia sp. Peel2402 TaxID=3458296 RepID=UPI00403EF370
MRRRLVLAIAGVATASIVVLALPLALVLQTSHRDEELLRLARDTVAATRMIDLSTTPADDPVELPPVGARLAVYGVSGRRAAGAGPARAPADVRAVLRSGRPVQHAGDGQLVAVAPLYRGERVAGAVRAQRDDGRAARETRHAWLLLGAAALAIVLLAVLAAVILGRRLAAPLERLAAAARRLGDGDFSVRSPRSGIAEVDAVGGALDTTAERLDTLVTRERSFTADASHQLRTPLQALRIELEAMELGGADAPELPRAIGQVDRLQGTIDTLLTVARDAVVPDAQTVLAPVLDAVAARWTGPLARDGRPLRVAVPADVPTVNASAAVLDEILDVLVDNAHRHGAGPVTVTARELEGWVAIEVGDDGPGLGEDPDARFVRRTEGEHHGIGLALARSLAHAEGGRLTARAGQRPVVTLTLRAA